ncbi:hypothetical protein MUP32_06445 [Candidatus Microgenomates bacterium]|nr:hypothetical protein [Candidatus Microgenomates bacterium]
MSLKDKFYKIYGNLPLVTRDEIILFINGEGISWKVAKLYIDQDTPLAKEILEKLAELRII